LLAAAAELTSLKLVLALAGDIGYHHGDHSLVNINSRDVIGPSTPPLAVAESVP
jgi:hypothetical protein